MPDIERIFGGVDSQVTALRDEMRSHFNAIYERLDCLESGGQALRAAVERLEERMTIVEQKLDRMALRSELLELKAQVASLEERITQLETEIEAAR